MTRIVPIRHGHLSGISHKRFCGRSELQLTPLGIAQAEAVALRIAAEWRSQAIYSSPMRRCVATVRAIAIACKLSAETLDGLNDLDYCGVTGPNAGAGVVACLRPPVHSSSAWRKRRPSCRINPRKAAAQVASAAYRKTGGRKPRKSKAIARAISWVLAEYIPSGNTAPQ